jgi:hypothetical protein
MSDLVAKLHGALEKLPESESDLKSIVIGLTRFTRAGQDPSIAAQSPVIEDLLRLTELYAPQKLGTYGLICLDNLALFPVNHKSLIASGALKVASGLLKYLNSGIEDEIDCGLSAAFLICRLAGNQ